MQIDKISPAKLKETSIVIKEEPNILVTEKAALGALYPACIIHKDAVLHTAVLLIPDKAETIREGLHFGMGFRTQYIKELYYGVLFNEQECLISTNKEDTLEANEGNLKPSLLLLDLLSSFRLYVEQTTLATTASIGFGDYLNTYREEMQNLAIEGINSVRDEPFKASFVEKLECEIEMLEAAQTCYITR